MRLTLLVSVAAVCLGGCDFREREEALQKRETALNQKEQELQLKEKTLQLQEQKLQNRKLAFDSTRNADSTQIVNPTLVGNWDVKMTCTETTCAGSAVGDTKNETWQLAYQGTALLAKANANNQLVRVYTGYYNGNTIELLEDKTSTVAPSPARMVVRLRIVDSTRLEGEREIVRENDCKVVYALQMEKIVK